MRGRPREFDRDEVLERAMHVFWERGYDGTSVADLVEAMAIGRQSLYGAFGDKRKLFEEALAHYTRTELEPFLSILGGPGSPTERLHGVIAHVRTLVDRQPQLGCLAARTAASQLGTDPDLAAAATAAFKRLEDAFTAVLEAAREAGELAAPGPPRALARTFMAAFHGLSVMVPVTGDLQTAEDVLRTLEAFLAAPETS